jgi:hypothetical protein
LILPKPFDFSSGGETKRVQTPEARICDWRRPQVQQAVVRKQFDYSTCSHTQEKALWQGLSRPRRIRRGATSTRRHCIKDGIFIDPPYNTGSDFIYRDNFTQSREEYDEEAGVYDEDGSRLYRNTESNGRFHSDGCSMIYPRLVLARNLLRSDGAIFVSIDESEASNLRKICEEVFGSVQFKQRMPEGKKPRSIFTTETVLSEQGTTSAGADDVYAYFKKDVFSNPKPVALIKFILGFGLGSSDIVVDFFSGSGTISEAVMQLNASDGGKRKYIAVQLEEDIDSMLNSSSANAKRVAENAVSVLDELHLPHFITELAKERIRRAGDKIKDEAGLTAQGLDIGFRVLKLDDSNMREVYFNAQEWASGRKSDGGQLDLEDLIDNVKDGRNAGDLLYGCLLEWGLPLNQPYTVEQIAGFAVQNYNDGDLFACFEKGVSEELVRELAARCKQREPLTSRVVFRDSSFASSPQKINLFEIFKLLAPNASVKVI